MRKVLIEKEIFKFEELSKNAQNKIIENERVVWQDDFELCVQDFLETKFPNIEWNFNENPKVFDFEFKVYENLIKKMKKTLREFFNNTEKNFENLGYDIIYPSTESCIVVGAFDDYEYFENGDVFDESEV